MPVFLLDNSADCELDVPPEGARLTVCGVTCGVDFEPATRTQFEVATGSGLLLSDVVVDPEILRIHFRGLASNSVAVATLTTLDRIPVS